MKYAMDNLVASPCCFPDMALPEVLKTYSRLGFKNFEVLTRGVQAAFDVGQEPDYYLTLGRRYRMCFTSFHLPPVSDPGPSLERAIQAARFARVIGAQTVLFKATTRPLYIQTAGPFLEGIQKLGLTPVLQNHAGGPICTLEDFREVLDGIADRRMKALLEVGHFHSVGISWREGWALLQDRVALVHIKDQIGSQSVPFGRGEIDLPGLFRHLRSVGYDGHYVIEMEVQDRENTLQYLWESLAYLVTHCWESGL